MTGDRLEADADRYRHAAGTTPPPPAIVSDPLVPAATPFEQMLRALVLAANGGDPQDHADSVDGHAERAARAEEAAEKFSAQDRAAAGELGGLAVPDQSVPDQSAAIGQQLPQAASALLAALSGALQPLTQLPQQFTQAAQQAVQAGTGLLQQSASVPIGDADLGPTDLLLDEFGTPPDDFAGTGFGIGAQTAGLPGDFAEGGGIAPMAPPAPTAPTTVLGPPPVPSAATAPAAAPTARITPSLPAGPSAALGSGFAGMPMIPPGAMAGSAPTEKNDTTATKRLSVPAVRNGAPVQGRLSPAPPAPAPRTAADGRPVSARRIVVSRNEETTAGS